MTTTRQVTMTDEEIDEFLGRRQTAVIALAYFDYPYAIPITYRYDPDTRTFYFRLVYPAGSEKRQFLPTLPEARLLVYEEEDPVYRSVIVTGRPREITESDLTDEHLVQFGETSRPLFEMWKAPKTELDIRLYELEPDEFTGRRIDTSSKRRRRRQ